MYSLLVSTFLATLALAAPPPLAPNFRFNGCDVSKASITLPANQTQLVAPTDTKPRFISIGVGVQNYTCTQQRTYRYVPSLLSYTN